VGGTGVIYVLHDVTKPEIYGGLPSNPSIPLSVKLWKHPLKWLGNLAIAAAKQGCAVTALDGSRTAVDRINEAANKLGLSLAAYQADLSHHAIDGDYDSIVAIGLLMFFPQDKARAKLADILAHTKPGGVAAVNVLIEGTTFMGMFEPGHYYLFDDNELTKAFEGWEFLHSKYDESPAPENTVKKFHTVVARKPK